MLKDSVCLHTHSIPNEQLKRLGLGRHVQPFVVPDLLQLLPL